MYKRTLCDLRQTERRSQACKLFFEEEKLRLSDETFVDIFRFIYVIKKIKAFTMYI